ncbi:hypothetical protein BD410DRAFT_788955 [Rickenella mellea]|uniref:Cyanobacterial phytochrome B n=1 Tax=Rickenella mellea TaxID=50990 RepID=A0A4Y7Q3Q7_9AGAM|nr:hypothetical protein BD410DRAFT_788955 [Rickenella mellea]
MPSDGEHPLPAVQPDGDTPSAEITSTSTLSSSKSMPYVYPVRSLLVGIQPAHDKNPPVVPNAVAGLPKEQEFAEMSANAPTRPPYYDVMAQNQNQSLEAAGKGPGHRPASIDSYFPLPLPSTSTTTMSTGQSDSPNPTAPAPNPDETTLFVLAEGDHDPPNQSSSEPRSQITAAKKAAIANAINQVSRRSSSQGSSSSEFLNLSETGIVHLAPAQSLSGDERSRIGSSQGSKQSQVSRYSNFRDVEPRSSGDSQRSSEASMVHSTSGSNASSEPLVTFRYNHMVDANGFHVVTGRGGKLTRCEDEPIHAPGAVQGFGVLIALEEDDETGNLVVRQVSENASELLGLSPKYLFGLDCFTQTLPDSQAGLLWDNVQFLQESELDGDVEQTDHSPQVFLLSGWGEPGSALESEDEDPENAPDRRFWTCWCATHRPPPSKKLDATDSEDSSSYQHNLIVIELELERDVYNPLYPPFPREVHPSGGSSPGTSVSNTNTGSSQSSGGQTPDASSSATASVLTLSTSSGGNATTTPTNAGQGFNIATGSSQPVSPPDPTSGEIPVVNPAEVFLSSNQGGEGESNWFPLPDDIFESTTSHSKPLKALERMRRVNRASLDRSMPKSGNKARARARRGAAAAGVGTMDIFAVLAQINDQLSSAHDLDTFLKVVVGVIKDLTQFHRVLVYQFDDAANGQVVAELVDWRQTHDLYKGLHFPATDIPPQAREMYKINKVRLLYDRSQATARLVVRSKADLEHPLDMTHSYLRAMSPIHVKYLANMGVRSSMSISILTFGALWGLISCHSYGLHGMRVSFPVRQMLRLLSDSISRNVERLSYAKRLHTRKLISTLPTDSHPTGYIVSNAEDLLGLFDADFGVLVIGEGAKILGPNERGQEILLFAEYLRLKQFNLIQMSQAVSEDFPDLQLPSGVDAIAGLLYVPLSKGGRDFICFLRKGQLRDVHWAGFPYKGEDTVEAVLEPRKSFKMWSERISGRCRAWTDEQMETAGVLALVYGKFIEVWRQKETAIQTTQLTNLLLSNASHEVRTPLNHIINYLEMALNGPLDNETRENLSRSHTASKSLLFTINDLLDLTKLESGKETSFNEPFDLQVAIEEAVNLYRNEATRRNLEFNLDLVKCPKMVIGDAKKIRTVVANLTANAVKYTTDGTITVSCHRFKEPRGLRDPHQVAVEIVVADTGCGIESSKLESIFREFEQVESSVPRSTNLPGLGLGLAVVARIVEQLGGQLRVDSKPEEGSRFSFLIPFALYSEDSERPYSPNSLQSSLHSSLRTRSNSSAASQKSEIDSIVEALAGGHMGTSIKSGSSSASHPRMPTLPPQDGVYEIAGSKYPIRSVKVDEFDLDTPVTPESSSKPAQTTPPERQKSSPRTYPIPSPAKLRVLIVEDDPINRNILSKRLTLDGHDVVTTTDGQEGLQKIEQDREFDCVLMDIQMPILNGFEATKQIRLVEGADSIEPTHDNTRMSKRLNGRIPIFAVSASLVEKQRDEMLALGMDGWILKPIDFRRLKVILNGIVDPLQREKDVYHPGCSWEAGGWLDDVKSRSPRPKKT